MSFYNMINGVNPATFFILPMLGKNPKEYPRFRDCWVQGEKFIQILTRTGGGNREEYQEQNKELQNMVGYIEDHDWEQDSTYAVWTFEVPHKWSLDFEKFMEGKKTISQEYRDQLDSIYPELKEKFEEILG